MRTDEPVADDLDQKYRERLDQKAVVTGRLSETTRFVGFGIIAWVFAVQSSDAEFSKSYVEQYEVFLNGAGILALLSIACDYFQYLSAYISVRHALTRRDKGYKYDRNHASYLLQNVCFVIKQVAVGLGAVTVIVTFALHIILH